VRLLLLGDVMTGRGIDQILPTPSRPGLHEPWVRSAVEYVERAQEANGPIPRGVDPGYVWGEALDVLERESPDVGIGNLETAVTTTESPADKGIHYRMHPENVEVLAAAPIHCWSLANNHVLDWGREGLLETLETLEEAGLGHVGAGRDPDQARSPGIVTVGDGAARVLVFAFAGPDCGVPPEWAAAADRSGVSFLSAYSSKGVEEIARQVAAVKRERDLAVASVHWGGNWGYGVPRAHRRFARALIAEASVDVVHGHSSHHPKGVEIHGGRPILYGCGDFLNDYEGIRGHEEYRGDLVAAWLADFGLPGAPLQELRMIPFRIRNFRLTHPSRAEREWLRVRMDRECRRFGHRVGERDEGFVLTW
jgi:poly-gamma-glutamate capsule biosynthesis protein CapA/YwtB (metallophosphatase superfamily)